MSAKSGVGPLASSAFKATFAADWLFGSENIAKLFPKRWDNVHRRLQARTAEWPDGSVHAVDRRRDLTPDEFLERYFRPGIPVVLEGAAREWPAIRKWNPNYLEALYGDKQIQVLDGQNWRVNRGGGEAVSTATTTVAVRDLMQAVKAGGAWYGSFLELLDQYADLRQDLDFSFVQRFGHTNPRIPWHRSILAKMYVGGPNTSTSLHCAGISNLFLQVFGQKRWVLIPPQFTPFMYPAATRGINWQSRVDFRNPDYSNCPLYRLVDRYETVLGPGDILWNPPFVWHGVANLTESIAVSLWWTNVTRAFANNLMLSALTLCGRPNPIAMQLGLSRGKGDGESAFRVHLNR